MIELTVFGLLLGLGAAIPIGAINLEIIRRNLRFGTRTGVAVGFGACLADVTYLVLLSYGLLQFLNVSSVLKITGVISSLILAWFGYMALVQKSEYTEEISTTNNGSRSLFKHWSDGYLLTLINPYTIIFWTSVSMMIAANAQREHATFYAGLGVLLGTLSWICTLNTILHVTRSKISANTVHRINFIGGLILIGFALLGLWHSYSI